MQENQYRFTGIFIPAAIYENRELSWTQKLLWCEIQALSGADVCTANNEYFAQHLDITPNKVSENLTVLKNHGLIEFISFDGRVRSMRAVFSRPATSQATQNVEITPPAPEPQNQKIEKLDPFHFDPEYVKNEWNAIAKKINLAEIRSLTQARIKKLKMRLQEQNLTIEDFFKEIKIAFNESPFLRGKKWHEVPNYPQDNYWEDTEWRADFDFFLQPSSLQKVLEGKYADPSMRGKFH